MARLDSNGDGVPCESLPGAPETAPLPATADGGYLMLERNGSVFGFGDLVPLTPVINGTSVSIAGGPNGGYWVLGSNGVVTSRGLAHFGNVDLSKLSAFETPTTIAGLPDGSGYWVFTNKGRAIAFGGAQHFGDMSAVPLNGGVVASATTRSGRGYWMVGADGGIFSFGDAAFFGSTGATGVPAPVVGIISDPDGSGYWLIGADGAVYPFEAEQHGSMSGTPLNKPVVGGLAYGGGYLLVASDGGIFNFSGKPFLGSLGASPTPNPIVGVAVRSAT